MQQFFAVIGDPIAHSMSPAMHNELFQLNELDAYYLPLRIKSEDLRVAVAGLRAIGIAGFNVTVPHKEAIMPLLDEIDPLAKAIGAVNTVVNQAGKLVGYNTDGTGYIAGLKEDLQDFNQKKMLIIGAGGAARGIYYALAEAGVEEIDICNRTLDKARKLAMECPYPVKSTLLTIQEAEQLLAQYDCIIQTTSIGMSPHIGEKPLSLKKLNQHAFVSDIIYNPHETAVLHEAKQRGVNVQNGLNMFVYQGALAFEKWTGILPDSERMKKNVLQQLGG
ncbi:shikimate dehydrogenase [Cytobacillus horneckiae]|uniref:Shikimate dehydrogenase (NADP(+)) n=1 Tax=Cytobacillus horneckiae TaxID=549687 RepID=A0A2N0ZIA9_9BACI|nr:shikimate dehydrogenase [Cytobacillus horneckiae]MEC1155260.1 shikimate dehydrogenase [Cytobacillus horneckiae]MED2936687.1 shikimate dehydrogenase [Cytobacillus horneckiae]PKG29240.1 shikimate dehydrogenase [Cytobacillus horneckiae]